MPMTFASINGHEQQKNILRRILERQRIGHAYLFEGPDGVGKKLTAMAFARALLCLHFNGCGDCSACRKVDHNNHPDIHRLDTKTAGIKIDQVRALQQELALHPLEGRHKICLIDNADTLTHNAANALLKTLEEPQPDTVLILITSRPEKLLPTIRSRCQRLSFSRLTRVELAGILQHRLELSDTKAKTFAALCQGSLDKALGPNSSLYLEKRHSLIQSLSALSSGSTIQLFNLADELAADKEQLMDILNIFQAYYRDLLLLKHGRSEEELANQDMLETLPAQSRLLTTEQLLKKLHVLDRARVHLQRNVNRLLALEIMLLHLTTA